MRYALWLDNKRAASQSTIFHALHSLCLWKRKSLRHVGGWPPQRVMQLIHTTAQTTTKLDWKFNSLRNPCGSFPFTFRLLMLFYIYYLSALAAFRYSRASPCACDQYNQVQQYIQLLWKDIDPFEKNLYYGAVEGAVTLLGAITSFAAGFLNSKKFDRFGMWLLAACSAIEGVLLMWASDTNSLYMCYFMYIAFGALHNFMITAAR